jgi:hypothetical protein
MKQAGMKQTVMRYLTLLARLGQIQTGRKGSKIVAGCELNSASALASMTAVSRTK